MTFICSDSKAALKSKVLNNLGEYVLTLVLEKTKRGMGLRPPPQSQGKAGWIKQGDGARRNYPRSWSEHQLVNTDQRNEQVQGLGGSGWLEGPGAGG